MASRMDLECQLRTEKSSTLTNRILPSLFLCTVMIRKVCMIQFIVRNSSISEIYYGFICIKLKFSLILFAQVQFSVRNDWSQLPTFMAFLPVPTNMYCLHSLGRSLYTQFQEKNFLATLGATFISRRVRQGIYTTQGKASCKLQNLHWTSKSMLDTTELDEVLVYTQL